MNAIANVVNANSSTLLVLAAASCGLALAYFVIRRAKKWREQISDSQRS